jgi:hypothetical protein
MMPTRIGFELNVPAPLIVGAGRVEEGRLTVAGRQET